MIESMHIENFKCFKDFDIELGKFNVLIGPNDSGKTAFLQAVRLLTLVPTGGPVPRPDIEKLIGFTLGKECVWATAPSKRKWAQWTWAFAPSWERSSAAFLTAPADSGPRLPRRLRTARK